MTSDDARAVLDEDLVVPDRARPTRWLVVIALLAVGATAWALLRTSSAPRHAPRHAAPPSAVAAPTTHSVCGHCTVWAAVSPQIDSLVRAYLPRGVRLRVRTTVAIDASTGRSRFVARDIDAVAGSVTVLIRVERGGAGTRAIAPDPPGVGSLLLHSVNSGYLVRLQYLAPETVPPASGRLAALIRDPRLTRA